MRLHPENVHFNALARACPRCKGELGSQRGRSAPGARVNQPVDQRGKQEPRYLEKGKPV